MIKRIKSIKNLGVFNDYKPDRNNVQDFKEKNILYGWNYSGKTTLSRLFSYLDKDTNIDSEYNDVEFEVELTDGTTITNINKDTYPLSVKVFNTDFIRDKLHFGTTDNKIEGIKFAVGEIGDILKQIEENKKIIVQEKGKLDETNIAKFAEFNSKFTNEARRIKNDCFNSLIDFTKAHFEKIMRSFSEPYESYTNITTQELSEIKANALAQNTKQEIPINIPILQYTTLFDEVKSILLSSPTKTVDDELLSDKDLYPWAKQGFEIYRSKEPKITKCAFCGSDISSGRLDYLNTFYTNEAAKLKTRISEVIKKIESEKQIVNNLDWSKKSKNDIVDALQIEFEKLQSQYSEIALNYNKLLDLLEEKLKNKNDNNLFISTDVGNIDDTAKTQLEKWISSIKDILEKHNKHVTNFESVRNEAREKYKKYLVAKFLIDENYKEIERLKDAEERFKGKINKIICHYEDTNNTLQAKIKSISKGKEKLTEFIQKFLNRTDISIDITDDDYFILKRGDKPAKNLSEGEKTVIAFSHFMIMLDSLKSDGELQDTIVFIDDPISSLDANHIAQVSSLLNSFFFSKGLDKENPDKICNCFQQLFIATHNFEFFSFLKQEKYINKKKKETCSYYLIKRLNEKSSTLQCIPTSLSEYNSEYVYLFSEIDNFKEKGCPEDESYIMPNIIRRFLEIYTLIKLPGNAEGIDNRIKKLIGDVNELKILHTFSHFTSFEQVTKHDELIFRIRDIIDDLYKLLNKDKEHLDSLYEGIDKKIA